MGRDLGLWLNVDLNVICCITGLHKSFSTMKCFTSVWSKCQLPALSQWFSDIVFS